jgi:hypothetical protein
MNRPGLVPALLLIAAPLFGQPDVQNLLTNSPFGQARSAGTQETPGAAWEFRGVAEEAGEVWYSLFDTTAKRSVWVRQGETPPGLAIRTFDPSTLTLSLDYQGKNLVLPIKRAPQVAQPVTLPAPTGVVGGTMPMPNSGSGPAPALNANSPADAQRIQQVTEEIRRRRALRQQAVQQALPAPPTGNP